MVTKKILMTGVTGFLGRNLIPLILKDPDLERIFLLSRSPQPPPELSDAIKDERVQFIQGDVERKSIFSSSDRTKLREEGITHILHSAALTAFLEKDRPALTRLNVNGTQHMINFARECKKLENFIQISTAYAVNGRDRTKGEIVLEDPKYHPSTFGNPYEETKFQSERLILSSGLPVSILRPSIFAGNSKTGETGFDSRAGHGVVYGLARAASTHPKIKTIEKFFLWREQHKHSPQEQFLEMNCRIAGYPNITKNFMFIDDIAGQTNAIYRAIKEGSGQVFHIISKTSITTQQMLDAMQHALRVRGFYFAGNPSKDNWEPDKNYLPEVVAGKIVGRNYTHYFTDEEPLWDTNNTDAALEKMKYKRINMTNEKFRWLMEQYVSKELETILRRVDEKKRILKAAGKLKHKNSSIEETPFKEKYIEYVKDFGTDTMSYSTLQPDLQYFHMPNAGFIAFKILPPLTEQNKRVQKFGRRLQERVEEETGLQIPLNNTTTIHALANPVCKQSKLEELITSFLDSYPNACFWQTSIKVANLLKEAGYKINEFGIDTLIDLQDYSFSGKQKQNIRTAYNKAQREGIIIKEEPPQNFNWEQARKLSESWIEMKHQKNPEAKEQELSFLARPMQYHPEEDVRIFSAKKGENLEGFVVYSPIYNQKRVTGYLADILRHSVTQRYGICDAINIHAFNQFKKEGIQVISLGLSPFAHIEEGDSGDPIIHEIFKQTYRDEEANDIYHFKGNELHKSRYGGRIEPVYFCTREDIPLEQIINLFRACKAF